MITGQLHSPIVLDDQLVPKSTDRLRWFGERLLKSVHESAHQVIVVACRAGEFPSATDDGSLCVLNLAGVVSRS